MRCFLGLFLLVWVTVCGATADAPVDDVAPRVVVLANSGDAESVRLARHYMEMRRVPAENLVSLPMPNSESIGWREFIDKVYQPVQDELVRRGWIQGIGSSLQDKLGRKRYSITGHKISFLVVCRGVPLKIEDDPTLYEPNPPLTSHAEFRTNRGAVDSELALLAQSGYPINAAVPNPFFNRARPSFLDTELVVKVGRIDGPTYAEAAALVDNAIQAERTGLIGRAYVDLGGPHPDGDKWLEATAKEIEQLDFDLDVDRKPETLQITARFDAPVLYFGWYTGSLNGPFTRPGFHFPPGAVALHIHSFSAQTLHSAESNWCGPLVARGVTATFGNVHEPYLPFTHRPQIIVHALAEGKRLGDAASLANPVLSWQTVLIGDPLFRPFAVSFAEQWERRHGLTGDQYAYVLSREINRLCRSGQVGAAEKVAKDGLAEKPTLLLAWKAARLYRDNGRADDAERLIDAYLPLAGIRTELVPVAVEIAQFYSDRGATGKVVEIYRSILSLDALSPEEKLALLKPAIKAAEAAGAEDILNAWKKAGGVLEGKH